MSTRVSVYLDDNAMYKLGDLRRVLRFSTLGDISISKTVSYAIIKAWQTEFVDSLDPDNWDEETQRAVEKYAPASGGNGRDEQ